MSWELALREAGTATEVRLVGGGARHDISNEEGAQILYDQMNEHCR